MALIQIPKIFFLKSKLLGKTLYCSLVRRL